MRILNLPTLWCVNLLTFIAVSSSLAQGTTNIGIFEGASDVGKVAKSGSVVFDTAKGEYRMTGCGANIWAKHDDFYFLWRKVSGDVSLTATFRFEGEGGVAHRKVALMIRNTLEPGSPHVNAAVHLDGLAALQCRELPDDITKSVPSQVKGPTRIRLERHGDLFKFYAGKEGQPLMEAGTIQMSLTGPVYLGLAICLHDPLAEMTAVFSDVTVEVPKSAGKDSTK